MKRLIFSFILIFALNAYSQKIETGEDIIFGRAQIEGLLNARFDQWTDIPREDCMSISTVVKKDKVLLCKKVSESEAVILERPNHVLTFKPHHKFEMPETIEERSLIDLPFNANMKAVFFLEGDLEEMELSTDIRDIGLERENVGVGMVFTFELD